MATKRARKKRFKFRWEIAAGVVCLVVVVSIFVFHVISGGGNESQGPSDRNANSSVNQSSSYPPASEKPKLPQVGVGPSQSESGEPAGRDYEVLLKKFLRDPSLVDSLSEAEIDAFCEAFINTPYGPEIRPLAKILGMIGTEKAVRTLASLYQRENLPMSFSDNGVAVALGKTHSPLAEDLLIDIYENLRYKQFAASVLAGLSYCSGSEEVTSLLIEAASDVSDKKRCGNALMNLTCLDTDRSLDFIEGVALGDYPELVFLRERALVALGYSNNPDAVLALKKAALINDRDDKWRKRCIQSLGTIGKLKRVGDAGGFWAVESLDELARREDIPGMPRDCIRALAKIGGEKAKGALGGLAVELQDEELRNFARKMYDMQNR